MDYKDEINYVANSSEISLRRWEQLMDGAKKANGSKIRKMIKEQIPELYHELALQFYNPYEANSKKTKTHYIYVHSSIEYFLKRN